MIQTAKRLASESSRTRMPAACDLGDYGGTVVATILGKAIPIEKNNLVRGKLLRALSRALKEEVVPRLELVLTDTGEDSHVFSVAMEGLYDLQKQGRFETLRAYLKDRNPLVRRRSVQYLALLGDASAVPEAKLLIIWRRTSISKTMVYWMRCSKGQEGGVGGAGDLVSVDAEGRTVNSPENQGPRCRVMKT